VIRQEDERELAALLAYLPAVAPAWRDEAHAIPRRARAGKPSLTEASRATAHDPPGKGVVGTLR
jgi:hypothetical protein